jgi:cysteine sulfinate desulfinase/cysteine desulfurase-like protein
MGRNIYLDYAATTPVRPEMRAAMAGYLSAEFGNPSSNVEPSHVMQAMGREADYARNTLRLSVGWGTRAAEIEYVLEKLPKLVRRVRESVAPR